MLSNYARLTALISALATIAGLFIWAAQAPAEANTTSRLALAALASLPLVFSAIGLAKHRTYTAAWTCMLAVFYSAFCLSEYLVAPASLGLWLTLLSSTVLFASSTLYPRLRSREMPDNQ